MQISKSVKHSAVIFEGIVPIDVLSIGIMFEGFMQADCRDQGAHNVLQHFACNC